MSVPFLKSCCRVCLVQEHIMIYLYDIVDEYNMTLSDLLETCVNLKINSADLFTKLICKECTEELLMVAKFQEKCRTSEHTLNELTQSMSAAEMEISEAGSDTQLGMNDISTVDEISERLVDVAATNSSADQLVGIDPAGEPEKDVNSDQSHDNDHQNTIIEYTSDNDLFCSIIEEDANDSDANSITENNVLYSKSPEPDVIADTSSTTAAAIAESDNSTVIPHQCECCGAGFMQLNNLRKHLQSHIDDLNDDVILTRDDAQPEQQQRDLFECVVCPMVFTSRKEFAAHKAAHADEPLAAGRSNKRTNSEHRCVFCERQFVSGSLLATHVRVHTGERPFQCSKCPKTFATRGGLVLHLRRHLGVKPFECPHCERRFVESSNLRVHMRTHTGEKPHQCSRCPRRFARVFLLQIHQRTHTGERPFACATCGKAFAQQGDLAAHKRTHTGERPHQCHVCGKGFIKSSALTHHMRMHERNGEVGRYGELNEAEDDGVGLLDEDHSTTY